MASEKKPIHSNQGQQLQRHKFSLLHFEKGLGLRRIAAMCQHAERVALSLRYVCERFCFWSGAAGTQMLGRRSSAGYGSAGPPHGLGQSDRVPGPSQCYKYSRSRAWCRAMRSEWLEILQKGMLCWKDTKTRRERERVFEGERENKETQNQPAMNTSLRKTITPVSAVWTASMARNITWGMRRRRTYKLQPLKRHHTNEITQ